jgi:hypothetical protein
MSAFLKGFGRALDLGANFKEEDTFIKDDAEAIYSDWLAVGNEIKAAIYTVASEKTFKRTISHVR